MAVDKKEEFVSRWSRLKKESEQPVAPKTEAPMPTLPPVEALTPESDFKGFMDPRVGDALRRVALKKLFSDPHFNVPDPYEAYSGDWTVGEAIPQAMLDSLEQMKALLKKPPEALPAAQEKTTEKPQPETDEPGKQDA